jgi:hypothetical protein
MVQRYGNVPGENYTNHKIVKSWHSELLKMEFKFETGAAAVLKAGCDQSIDGWTGWKGLQCKDMLH